MYTFLTSSCWTDRDNTYHSSEGWIHVCPQSVLLHSLVVEECLTSQPGCVCCLCSFLKISFNFWAHQQAIYWSFDVAWCHRIIALFYFTCYQKIARRHILSLSNLLYWYYHMIVFSYLTKNLTKVTDIKASGESKGYRWTRWCIW